MDLSKIVDDSGKLDGGRSNFSKTASLLSQYLKEKGNFGDLARKFQSSGASAAGTMNLFPMIMEKSGETQLPAGEEEAQKKSDLGDAKSGADTSQMTIFYGGQVLVFDDFPAVKVSAIMMLAHQPSGTQNNLHSSAFATQRPSESSTGIPSFGLPDRALVPPLGSDLPIARRNSLARFLEKRKDRIKEKAPYQEMKPAPPELAMKFPA